MGLSTRLRRSGTPRGGRPTDRRFCSRAPTGVPPGCTSRRSMALPLDPFWKSFWARFVSLRFAWHPDSRHVSVWGVRPDTGLGFWTIALDGTDVSAVGHRPRCAGGARTQRVELQGGRRYTDRIHLVASRRCLDVRRDVARRAQPLESRRRSADARLDPGTRAVDHVIRSQREAADSHGTGRVSPLSRGANVCACGRFRSTRAWGVCSARESR